MRSVEDEEEEEEEEGRRDVVRSARLNYPDVLAQIRLPVYAHNAVRNVQSTGNHHPPPSLLLLLRRHSRRHRRRRPSLSRPEEEEAEEKELEPMYPHVCSLCVFRGWAHIDRYVPPVAR